MNLFTMTDVDFKSIIKYERINIEEGICTFICGKSGSGKSTLLKLLNASQSFDSGEILYHGLSLLKYDTISLRQEVMLVSQSVYLFDETIEQNFKEFYQYRHLPLPNTKTIIYFLNICQATFPLTSECRELSGGERQRVYLAICLSLSPKVLMLDEPTSALDDLTSHSLMKSLKDYCLKQHISMIVITHDLSLSKVYADALIQLDGGDEHE